MPKASQLSSDLEKSLLVPFGDTGGLTITYDRSRYTARVEAENKRLLADSQPVVATSRLLAAIITAWDLVDDRDEPVPLTEETFMDIDPTILNVIVNAIEQDVAPPAVQSPAVRPPSFEDAFVAYPWGQRDP